MTTPGSDTPSAETLQELLGRARGAVAADPETAVALSGECAARAEAEGDLRTAAAAWRTRGQALRALGRHAEAIPAFQEATRTALAAGDPLLAAQVRLGEIDSLALLGRLDDASALAESLVSNFQERNAPIEAAKALCNLGNVYLRADRYTEALSCYERADQVFSAPDGDPLMHALVQVNRAISLTHLGGIEEAIALFAEAGDVYRAREYAYESAVVESNVGVLHHASGRYAAAIASFNRAHTVFTELGRALEAARCDVDRSDSYRALNLTPEALEGYQRAIATFQQDLPLDYDRARADMGCAAILLAQGRRDEGMAALERAEAIFRRQRNASQLAHARLVRATALWEAGRSDESVALAQQAARTFARRKLHGWAAEARFLIAAVALEAGDTASTQALRRMAAVSRVARTEGRGWLECRAEQAQGRFYANAGRTAQALRHLRDAAAALESARTLIAPEEMHTAFLRDKLSAYEDLCALLLARGRPADVAEALDWAERSRSRLLLDRVATAGAQTGGVRGTLSQRLESLRAELSRAYRQATDVPREGDTPRRFTIASPVSLTEIERAYSEALRDVELETAPGPTLTQGTVSLASLRDALAPNEILLSFFATRDAFSVFLVERTGLRALPSVTRIADVEQVARRLRYHLQKVHAGTGDLMRPLWPALQAEIDGVLERLYTLLLKPLEPYLGGREKVIVVPHGRLHELPFHAFFDGTQYAQDRWEFVYAPSATIWHHVRTQNRGRALPTHAGEATLLVAVPLPGIEQVLVEVDQLASLLPGARTLRGSEATRDAVIQGAREAKVLHLATHAHFRKDNPHFSGLQLSDGWLLTRDLYELAPLGCDLVTLSACETGVSRVDPGDELFGLVRGFLAAGSRTVLGALWPADDTVTVTVMTEFYAARQEGHSAGTALRRAQQCVRHDFPHAYHWAAFSLFGDSDGETE